jgi:hypothetical protein
MKTRIILTIILLIGAGWLSPSIGEPVSVLAKNQASVATVNGGNAEYIAQSTVNNTVSMPWIATGAFIGLVIIWVGPIKTGISKTKSNS